MVALNELFYASLYIKSALEELRLLNILFMFQEESFTVGLKLLPFIYAVTVAINLFSVFYKGSHCKLFILFSIFMSIDS